MFTKLKSILVGVAALVMVGCASPNQFAEPIGKLEAATNITLEVTKQRFDRSIELTRERAYVLAWTQHQLVRGTFIEENSAEFTGALTDEALQARIDLLQELQNFCRLLAKVAGSDVDQQFGAAVLVTGNKLSDIGKKLGGTDDLGSTVIALSKVVATIGSHIIEARREEAIRVALREASPKVKRLTQLIGKDLDTLQNQTTKSLDALVSSLVNECDLELQNPIRLKALMVLSKYNLERLRQPRLLAAHKKALKGLEDTFGELEKFEPGQDISSMLGQIETFLSEAFSLQTIWGAK